MRKGDKATPEMRQRMSEAQKKRPPITEETRRKLSQSLRGRVLSEIHKRRVGDAHRGRTRSAEMKARIAATLRAKPKGAEHPNWKGGRSVKAAGYVLVRQLGHPRAGENGYVLEHILIMEEKLGRYLAWLGRDNPASEVVHHIDENPSNNDPANLQLMTVAEHTRHHLRGARWW